MLKPLHVFSLIVAVTFFSLALSLYAGEAMPVRFPTTAPPNPVKVEVLTDTSAIVPGQSFRIGFLFQIDPEWHIYWENPGDAGLATAIELALPEGFISSKIYWPLPKEFMQPGNLLGYGYEGKVMLMAEVTPPAGLEAGEVIALEAQASWLACRHVCVQGSAEVSTKLIVATQAEPVNPKLFTEWSARLPLPAEPSPEISNLAVKATASSAKKSTLIITVSWKAAPEAVQFFPTLAGNILFDSPTVKTTAATTEITLDARHPAGEPATDFTGLLTFLMPGSERKGFLVTMQLPTRSADAAKE